jgi:hypothetical protein
VEDFLYIALMVAFCVLAALFVVGCDKLIGPDEEALVDVRREELEPEREAA